MIVQSIREEGLTLDGDGRDGEAVMDERSV